MSVFTIDHAHQFAQNAFRNPSPDQESSGEPRRPLVGKEDMLLEALQAAEQCYLECEAEIEAIRKLRKSDAQLPPQCTSIVGKLREIAEQLSRFNEVSREDMNLIALYQGSSFEEMSQRINDLLDWFAEGAEEVFPSAPFKKTAGAKRAVGKGGVRHVPLEEFAKELRNFFTQLGLKFSFEEVKRFDCDPSIYEPVSVATRLLYDAARILDDRVGMSDIRTVMRAVKRNPDFRTELLGDPGVDDQTRFRAKKTYRLVGV